MNIVDALADLDWKKTAVEQATARQMILDDQDFDVSRLILPLPQGKGTWENAARVLVEMGHDRIGQNLENVLVWLQDLNWPGAYIIYSFLLGLPDGVLLPPLRRSIERAKLENDEMWLQPLEQLHEREPVPWYF